MASRITYCTGFWPLAGNVKRGAGHYLERIPATLRLIRGARLVLFHDDAEVVARFAAAAAAERVDLVPARRAVADLPTFGHAERFLEGCRAMDVRALSGRPASPLEKGLRHRRRDLLRSGEDVYRSLVSIWTSKVPLAAEVAATLGGADRCAWIDASISRFERKRENWDFAGRDYGGSALYHYGSPMYFRGERLPLNASFLLAAPAVWSRLAPTYLEAVERCAHEAYAHDEETVLAGVLRALPELFVKLGDPHNTALPPRRPLLRRLVAPFAARASRLRRAAGG